MGMERTDHTVSPTGELNAVCVDGAARETPTHIFYGTYVSRLINFGELNGKQKPTKNLKLVLEADTSGAFPASAQTNVVSDFRSRISFRFFDLPRSSIDGGVILYVLPM